MRLIGQSSSGKAIGPYISMGLDLNPCVNKSIANCGVDPINAPHVIAAQEAFLFRLPLLDSAGEEQWVWAGDAWASAPDGIKSHDLQPWTRLTFNVATGSPLPLQKVDQLALLV